MSDVFEFLRFWDVLRLCCGSQMSEDWRNELNPAEGYTPHHDVHGSSFPACRMYDIDQVSSDAYVPCGFVCLVAWSPPP